MRNLPQKLNSNIILSLFFELYDCLKHQTGHGSEV
jgi:hypothetical protein